MTHGVSAGTSGSGDDGGVGAGGTGGVGGAGGASSAGGAAETNDDVRPMRVNPVLHYADGMQNTWFARYKR